MCRKDLYNSCDSSFVMKFLLVLLVLLTQALALNIVLSTPDNWANNNLRSLYYELTKQNHKVLLAGPLYDQQLYDKFGRPLKVTEDDNEDTVHRFMNDGGAYGHLQSVNQLYHFKLQQLADTTKLPNIPKLLRKTDPIPMSNTTEFINNGQFGYDPLDSNHWYINSENPKNMLPIFLDNIIPSFYESFTPDLVIIVSASGQKGRLDDIQQVGMIHELPTITVDLADMKKLYFLHESLNSLKSQPNKISSFINEKVISTIDKLRAQNGPLMPLYHSVSLQFPEYANTRCKLNSELKFAQLHQLLGTKFTEFAFVKNELTKSNVNMVGNKEYVPEKDTEVEQKILDNCDIAVSINHLFKKTSEDWNVFT